MMTTGRAFEEGVRLAKENLSLDMGLHLSLTVGKPVSNDPDVIRSLAPSGAFRFGNRDLLIHLLLGKISPSVLHREIEAQFKKAVDTGLRVTHVDGHESIHLFPGIRDIVFEMMKHHGIVFIRRSYERIPLRKVGILRHWKKVLLNLLGLLLVKRIRGSGLRTTDYYYGSFDAGYLGRENVAAMIVDLREGTSEIMCHPGYRDASFDLISGGRYLPEQELRALTHAGVKNLLRERGVQLISFSDL
jgi:predicted glycoside hydrolase/deacetylase ChbG (UPF0249 family)